MYIQDPCGNTLEFKKTPQRIVCLVPSITEFLCEIGLEDSLVGITKFCVHPKHLRKSKKVIGGTKNYHLDSIRALSPDIIIANKEENVKESIDELKSEIMTYVSDINTIEESYVFMRDMGMIFDRTEVCEDWIQRSKKAFSEKGTLSGTFAYLIWKNPFMVAANDTFIHNVLQSCGLENVFSDLTRYPEMKVEELQKTQVKYIFLSTEPFPFKEADKIELQELFPFSKVVLVDGEVISWYGCRFMLAPKYLSQLLL